MKLLKNTTGKSILPSRPDVENYTPPTTTVATTTTVSTTTAPTTTTTTVVTTRPTEAITTASGVQEYFSNRLTHIHLESEVGKIKYLDIN